MTPKLFSNKKNNLQSIISPALIGVALVIASFMLFGSGCKKKSYNSPTAAQGPNDIYMQNSTYSPATITVPVNTTVTWTNKDGLAHTVTSNSRLFDSGNINNNGTYSRQFTAAGTYPYHCNIHSTMVGTVIVQ